MKAEFFPYALQDVPRYTSFPTAVQFRDDFPGSLADQWMARLDPAASLSVYVHVPFCRQLCWYCGCHTSVPNGYERPKHYADLLVRDMGRTAGLVAGARGRVRHLHFGGGTPTYFHDIDLARIVAAVDRGFGFTPRAEVAIEIDPRTMERGRARMLAEIGFNRASLGVQDFALPVQMKINRVQPPGLVAACVAGLREAGFKSINFDLMYGLPGQTEASVAETAHLATNMAPDRLAVFGYAHVPWFKKHQTMISEAELPGVRERFAQATRIGEVLEARGYQAIGLDHYALPQDELADAARTGRLRRNFQGYTSDVTDALLAFGASAIGALPQGFVQAARDTLKWSTAVESGRNPVTRGLALTGEDRMRAEIIERLMCDLTVDALGIAKRHGFDLGDTFLRLKPLLEAGLAAMDGGNVTVPREHRLFLRTVASAFDNYFSPSPHRHAKAV
jgi:oxygen-independent coproporphyrinogen-3 oxidase